MSSIATSRLLVATGSFLLLLLAQCFDPAAAELPLPFDKLAGRWTGEGRLGMREGNTETVKCRVTYFLEGDGNQVRQNIRCASTSGSIEIVSSVSHIAGALTGSWRELTRNMSGRTRRHGHPSRVQSGRQRNRSQRQHGHHRQGHASGNRDAVQQQRSDWTHAYSQQGRCTCQQSSVVCRSQSVRCRA